MTSLTIIVGLGNSGGKYDGTRHNVGFMVVNRLVKKLDGGPWKNEHGVAWSKIGQLLVIKPQEFMNVSGPSLLSFLNYKHMTLTDPAQLLVIHDDVDFPLGEIHEQSNRSAGGHNGVQSIITALGSQDFGRLRIGIGNNRDLNIPAEEYVLQHFSEDEKKIITKAVDEAVELVSAKISTSLPASSHLD